MYKKLNIDGKKYIQIFGVRIPYETERSETKCTLQIGSLRIPYWHSEFDSSMYFKIGEKKLYFKQGRKFKHYRMRNHLTQKRLERVLTKELTSLLGYKPNLENPKTFNEKLNWSKIHIHDPLITTCCDKYAVKAYAEKIIGKEHVLPVLASWTRAEDVDFDQLPDQFALKVNWSSGYNIIVKDKRDLDIDLARRKIDFWMRPQQNSYYDMFNWGYKNMKPLAYVEPYIEQVDDQVYDYKFFISNGEFVYMFISTERYKGNLTYTFFDADLNPMPFTYGNKANAVPPPAMPHNVQKMIDMAKQLAKPFPFVRVDFYEVNPEEFYLGEMTFYCGGGTLPFNPIEWDRKLGEKITY